MTAQIDSERQALHVLVQPGVVTDAEQSLAAAQRVTEARYALWASAQRLHPTTYPPPDAGDGSDVFRAADESGEGKCTRKELAKYLMRNQTLRHRLREGWQHFNENFGTEDIPRNHEELDETTFKKLWAEAAAMRPGAPKDDVDAAQFKMSSVQPMRSQLADFKALLAESDTVDVHGLGNAINMLSTCVEILRGQGLLTVDKVRTFFPDGIRSSSGDAVPKMVVRVTRCTDPAALQAGGADADEHDDDGDWEDTANPLIGGEDDPPSSARPSGHDAMGLNPNAKEWVPGASTLNPNAVAFEPKVHQSAKRESAIRWRIEEWWRRESERLQMIARSRSARPQDYEVLLAPRTQIEDGAIREYLRDLRKSNTAQRTASDLLELAGPRGSLAASEAEVDGLARIFGNPKGDRRGREWRFLVPDVDVKTLCIAVANIVAGVQEGREEREQVEEVREKLAAEEQASGQPALLSLRLLADLAREDGNPPRVARRGPSSPHASPRRAADDADDDCDDDGAKKRGYDREHWNPLLDLFNGDVKPITNRARKAPCAADVARQSRTVHVGQLPLYVTEQELRNVFARCGTVTSVTLPTFAPNRPPPHLAGRRLPPAPVGEDGHPRRPNKGFAYIEFHEKAGAEKALTLDSYPMQGRALKVSLRHTETVGALAVEHGKRFYLSKWDHPRYRDDRAWVSY
eukprot:TRINITY_DN5814_c0_g2_i1.p1 TRINITY_DN5814_c0_g2~~TRINITY_DN5814_c0_g2_i1.p1  ORF type:complete len:707 (+),score=230.42 TRINITY_DN5814_c0_g2_i1:58-2121(+)